MIMTTTIRNAAVLLGLLLASAGYAQDKPANAQPVNKAVQERQALQDSAPITLSAEQMTQDLALSNEQSEKLKSIETDINVRLRSLDKLDPKERNAKEEMLVKEQEKKITSVLTAEQNRKLASIKAEMRKKNIKTNDPIAQ